MSNQDERWLLQEKYNGEKTEDFFTDCKKMALGEPLAYLIGHTPFLDCTIHLDARPLIPRVETEFWVEKAITAISEWAHVQPSLQVGGHSAEQRLSAGGFGWGAEGAVQSSDQPPGSDLHILDLCAGSGCIGVAVAKHFSAAQVDFGEIDRRLIPTIKKNIAANISNRERCQVFHSNLFESLPVDKKYDFILTNPPYIDPALNRVDDSVEDFEPHLALFGGNHGTEIIKQLIVAAPDHLAHNGQLWIEHEPEQVLEIAVCAAANGFSHTAYPDQYQVIRYSVLVLE